MRTDRLVRTTVIVVAWGIIGVLVYLVATQPKVVQERMLGPDLKEVVYDDGRKTTLERHEVERQSCTTIHVNDMFSQTNCTPYLAEEWVEVK